MFAPVYIYFGLAVMCHGCYHVGRKKKRRDYLRIKNVALLLHKDTYGICIKNVYFQWKRKKDNQRIQHHV
jgi:hypothetical protein